MKGLRLALVGAYPPPYGGISTHVQRLADRCMQQGIDCVVFDYSRPARKAGNVLNLRQPVSWCRLLFHRFDIIHLHVSGTRWMVPACFALLARLKGARFVLTYHSLRGNFDIPGQAAMKLTLKAAARIIAMNTEIREKLSGLGAAPEKIAIAPSFLPPAVKEEDAEEVPAQTREFIANHTPVIAANAFSITEYQGADLYGIDMCLELVAALKRDYPRIGLVVFLSQPSNKARFADYQRRTRELDIAENFLFHTVPCPFYPVLMKSDLFVRPTNTDGDAVSLREALYFRIPSVASDAVPRPEGAVLFRSRSTADFIRKVREVLRDLEHHRDSPGKVAAEDSFPRILEIYRELTEKRAENATAQENR